MSIPAKKTTDTVSGVTHSSTPGTCAAPSGGANTYLYDAAGNRTSATISGTATTYGYNAANEMTSVSGAAFTPAYDNNGNATLTQTGLALAYNTKNQATTATPNGGTAVTSTYADADSTERATVGATRLLTTPFGVNVSTTAGTATYYTRDPNGMLIGMRVGASHFYYHTDDLGSVLSITDNTGTQAASYTYNEYGTQTATTGTLTNPWRYAGGYNDNNGLTKFGTRYYDPTTGRWTQQDPISAGITNPAAANKYPYVGDTPTDFTDPSGRFSLSNYLAAGVVSFITNVLVTTTCGLFVVGFTGRSWRSRCSSMRLLGKLSRLVFGGVVAASSS